MSGTVRKYGTWQDYVKHSDYAKLEENYKTLEELLADYRRLTKEIAVIIDGDKAAEHPALCDVVLMVKELEKERDHWKANHDNMVTRLRLFTQREDLPVDRLPAYEELVRLQGENEELKYALSVERTILYNTKEENERLNKIVIGIAEAVDPPLNGNGVFGGTLVEAVVAMRKEAERYRYLRAHDAYSGPGLYVADSINEYQGYFLSGEDADEAIDTAMQKGGEDEPPRK